ncbi:MAG: DUF4357 domain-containing protein [Armatimonadetes bacterium]|nr:DUF4357 domain-containing protein [Armatimonadota bacterium]MBS1726038.1 GIY-YIG nuclease family protein [Armatimonadota bacterium]
MARGYSIRLFLPDGEPEGLKLIEKTNWSGLGVVCPRSLFGAKRNRPEFERTGVYLLVGEGDGVVPDLYIGEADEIRTRLNSHGKESKFDWQQVVFFVSKDNNLNKAHGRYLEWRLIDLSTKANRAKLHNGNAGSQPSLSEADIAEAEGFLDEMRLCFPLVGLDYFETPPPIKKAVSGSLLKIVAKGLTSHGYEAGSEFVVKKGSQASQKEASSFPSGHKQRRQSLVDSKVLLVEGDHLVFAQDYAFSSPSTAASVVLGRNANGRTEWVDEKGRTLKSIQEASE